MGKDQELGPASTAHATSGGRATIKVYVTQQEKQEIKRRAQQLNRSLSEYLRTAGLEGGPEKLTRTLARVDLRMMNFQIRKLLAQVGAHQSGHHCEDTCERLESDVQAAVEAVRSAMDAIIDAE